MSDRDEPTYDPDDPRLDPRFASAEPQPGSDDVGADDPLQLGPDTPEFGPEPTDEDRRRADEVYEELLQRLGEGEPQPRLAPVRRARGLLGDPPRAHPVIHITGTNGKTSTSRIIESLLRA